MKGIDLFRLAAAAAMLLSVTACSHPANYSPVYQQTSGLPDCPVSQQLLPQVFEGRYGTDAFQRPLNPSRIPVDQNGNCLTNAPVTDVYAGYPSQAYINILTTHYGYSYYGGGLYLGVQPVHYGVRLYSGPGVTVHRTYIPAARRVNTVTTLRNYPAQRSFANTTVTGANRQVPGTYAPYRATTSAGKYDANRPSATYQAPQRTFSAPSRIQDAPTRSYSAPARTFSAPSRSGRR